MRETRQNATTVHRILRSGHSQRAKVRGSDNIFVEKESDRPSGQSDHALGPSQYQGFCRDSRADLRVDRVFKATQ